jgi:tight adherence protein B
VSTAAAPLGALAATVAAAVGVHLLWTAGDGRRPVAARVPAGDPRRRARAWLAQAGLDEVAPVEFVAVSGCLALVGGTAGFGLFGGLLPAMLVAGAAATAPIVSYRRRRATRMARARDAWPRMIEEIRLLTGSLGRSIPQALFDVGRRGPAELQPAFAAAQREWLLSTDFDRTLRVLKDRLADPGADATCETLLLAHQLGGVDLDRRLGDLAQARHHDAQGRKDAAARQAGVRFARRFVLLVPLGMAMAGLAIGDGRAAYRTSAGQLLVVIAIATTAACWAWAGRIMRLPDEPRVFVE